MLSDKQNVLYIAHVILTTPTLTLTVALDVFTLHIVEICETSGRPLVLIENR